MHIAFVSRYLTVRRGGHERYLKRLIKGLLDRGCKITAFSSDFDADLYKEKRLERVKVRCCRFPQWFRYLSFNRNARRAVEEKKEAFDVIFTTEYVTFGDVYRAGAGLAKAEIDSYGTLSDRLSLKNRVKIGLQKKLFLNPSPYVIVNSESMRRQIMEYYGISEDRVGLVYNGIDTERFSFEKSMKLRSGMRRELGVGNEEFLCLTVGSNWKRKGIDRAVEMLASCEETRVKLLVAGIEEKDLPRSLRRLDGGAMFIGPVSEIERYYAAADLCIVPSRYDPAPNVILESLASGLPVAVSSECGLRELVMGEGCGFEFNAGAGNSLAKVVENCVRLRKEGSYEQMRESAWKLGRGFSMDSHIEEIMEILKMESKNARDG